MANGRIDYTKYAVPKTTTTQYRMNYYEYNWDYINMTSTDVVRLPTLEEITQLDGGQEENYNSNLVRRTATDFALAQGINQKQINTANGVEIYTDYLLADGSDLTNALTYPIGASHTRYNENYFGLRPVLTLDVAPLIAPRDETTLQMLYSFSKKDGKPIMSIGQYPQTKETEETSTMLEALYNGGKLQPGLTCTGRLYTSPGVVIVENPEFEFKGERYVRSNVRVQATASTHSDRQFKDGTDVHAHDTKWFRVEPINFEVSNWDKLSTNINPQGNINGTTELELQAEESLTGNVSSTVVNEVHSNLWQNYAVRAFLNGTSTEQMDRDPNLMTASRYNYTAHSFLQQALNEDASPVEDYVVIPDRRVSLEGCVGIKRIIFPAGYDQNITRKDFSGIDLQWVYKDRDTGGIVFATELPQDQSSCLQIYNINELSKKLASTIDTLARKNANPYPMFFRADLDGLANIAESASRANLVIPENFIKQAIETETFGALSANPNFTPFATIYNSLGKNDLYNSDVKIALFDFANKLGCFSGEMMRNKSNEPTNVSIAEHSSDVLSQCLNTQILTTDSICDIVNLGVTMPKVSSLAKLTTTIKKDKFTLPTDLVTGLIVYSNFDDFLKNVDGFKTFKSNLPNINNELNTMAEEEQVDFYRFAGALGCFSDKKLLDKNGRETDVTFAQKASSALAQMMKTNQLKLGNFHQLFDELPTRVEPNQEFLKFLSQQEKKSFPNLELLLRLEKTNPGILVKTMTNFEEAKSFRTTLGDEGMPITVPWEEALQKFYSSTAYIGVTEKTKDIAQVFASKGINQQAFNSAVDLREQAEEREIPRHILGVALREKTILESINEIKTHTEEVLRDSKTIIDNLYAKQFTYDMLPKNDAKNAIMGVYCSCCGTITSAAYGKDIVKSTIIAPDVQNMVVRNHTGEIVAKGTLYVNAQQGYAVINDFEVNQAYREHELHSSGRYTSAPDSPEEIQRDLIFGAFQRGVAAFVEEYDRENPNSPMQQVVVGMGYNRLKRQCEQFERATENLQVPAEYSFQDAAEEQHILYDRTKALEHKTSTAPEEGVYDFTPEFVSNETTNTFTSQPEVLEGFVTQEPSYLYEQLDPTQTSTQYENLPPVEETQTETQTQFTQQPDVLQDASPDEDLTPNPLRSVTPQPGNNEFLQ